MTVVQNLSDLDGSNGLKIIGKANSERIGAFISVRGHFDNDGIDDLSFAAFGEINHVVGPGDQISREPENGFLFEDGGVTAFIFGTAALKEIARYQVYPAAKE